MKWTGMLFACSVALALPTAASAAPPAASVTWTVLAAPPFPAGSLLGPLSCARAHTCLTVALQNNGEVGAGYQAPDWTSVSVPGFLGALACTAPSSCEGLLGVRASEQPVHWNGSTWKPQAFPKLNSHVPVALTCVGSRFCVAVGQRYVQNPSIPMGEPLIAVWNGRAWTDQRLSSLPRYGGMLSAISCPSADSCMAVGERDNPNGDGNGLGFSFSIAYHYNGESWKRSDPPDPAGAIYGGLASVSCPSKEECVAPSTYTNGSDEGWATADVWLHGKWQLTPLPGLPSAPGFFGDSFINDVDCNSPIDCVAVGAWNGSNPNGPYLHGALVEVWNGSGWRARRGLLPAPAGTNTETIVPEAISCGSRTTCIVTLQATIHRHKLAYALERNLMP
jgi:hypothetical protein